MSKVVRWGVLGAAKFARDVMIPALHGAPYGEVVALATRSAEKADPIKARIPRLRVVDGYQALIEDPDIDAVYIPLANHLHVEWCIRAMEAGKSVLCEKPIALQANDIEQLIAVRDRTGTLCAEAFMVCHHPQWQDVRKMIADGMIGRVRHMDAHFCYFLADETNIRSQVETGGGAVFDIGVYPLVGARLATGKEPEIRQVMLQREAGVDVVARIGAMMGSISFDFFCSMRMDHRQEFRFFGETGMIRMVAPFTPGIYANGCVELHRSNGTAVLRNYTGIDQYNRQVTAFNESVLNGSAYPCDLEFSLGNQRAVDTIFALGG